MRCYWKFLNYSAYSPNKSVQITIHHLEKGNIWKFLYVFSSWNLLRFAIPTTIVSCRSYHPAIDFFTTPISRSDAERSRKDVFRISVRSSRKTAEFHLWGRHRHCNEEEQNDEGFHNDDDLSYLVLDQNSDKWIKLISNIAPFYTRFDEI